MHYASRLQIDKREQKSLKQAKEYTVHAQPEYLNDMTFTVLPCLRCAKFMNHRQARAERVGRERVCRRIGPKGGGVIMNPSSIRILESLIRVSFFLCVCVCVRVRQGSNSVSCHPPASSYQLRDYLLREQIQIVLGHEEGGALPIYISRCWCSASCVVGCKCACVWVYIYMYIYMYICIYIDICMYINICVCVCVSVSLKSPM